MSGAEARELRWAVEPVMAERAARLATQAQAEELFLWAGERWRGRMSGNPDEFVKMDLRFHEALARASRSSLAAATHRMASAACGHDMRRRAGGLARHPDLDRLHDELVNAILEHRSAPARRIARRIAEIEAGLGDGLAPPTSAA